MLMLNETYQVGVCCDLALYVSIRKIFYTVRDIPVDSVSTNVVYSSIFERLRFYVFLNQYIPSVEGYSHHREDMC